MLAGAAPREVAGEVVVPALVVAERGGDRFKPSDGLSDDPQLAVDRAGLDQPIDRRRGRVHARIEGEKVRGDTPCDDAISAMKARYSSPTIIT
jgi:hypothetical protein